ncbi:MAG: ABC transporter permease [Polyangiaceae bacterium]|nr:ABC transporter permease [Polyangiaceae bacterium]
MSASMVDAKAPNESVAYRIGNSLFEISEVAGGMAVLLVRVLWRIARGMFDWTEFKRNMYKMGVKSTPIVIVTALFVGAIAVIQAAPMIQRYGAYGLLGWGAGFTVLRELGPLLTALMISGRVGANNTAELGTMVVTEQIDALRILAIDPLGFLIAPRLLAIVFTLIIATIYADALALFGAAVASNAMLGVEYGVFMNGLTSGLLNFDDVAHGLIKSAFFGLMMAVASCYFGLAVKGGAPGVGRAVNAGVVASATGIFILDYLVSFIIG